MPKALKFFENLADTLGLGRIIYRIFYAEEDEYHGNHR